MPNVISPDTWKHLEHKKPNAMGSSVFKNFWQHECCVMSNRFFVLYSLASKLLTFLYTIASNAVGVSEEQQKCVFYGGQC